MDWLKTISKSVLGFLTFIVGYLATNPDTILKLIPENITQMTIGGAIAALIVGLANYLKHKNN